MPRNGQSRYGKWSVVCPLILLLLAPAALAGVATPATLQQAEDAAQRGNCGEAENAVANLRAPSPEKAKALVLVGVCNFRIKNFSAAIPLLERAAKLAPHDEQLRIFLARAYSGAGRNQDAIETLRAWMKDHGEDADALYWTGNFYQDLASQTFGQMAAKHPNSYQVYEAEGSQFLTKQQFPQALEAYKKAMALAPADTPGLHFHLGDVYWRELRYDDAKRELQEELRLNPNHAQANYELGAIYAKERNPQQAVPYLQKAIALDPALIEAHRSLGNAYLEEKNYPAALAELLRVEKVEPSDHTIHAMLATTYRLMGRLEDAQREAKESEQLERQTIQTVQSNKAAEQKLGSQPQK
ncbi:MAG: tetratricopeptide repeat protein [Terriglobia bacterium]